MQVIPIDALVRRGLQSGLLIASLLCLIIVPLDAQTLIVRFGQKVDLSVEAGEYVSKNAALQSAIEDLSPRLISRPLSKYSSTLPAKLQQVQVWHLADSSELNSAQKQLSALPGVLSVTPLQHYKIDRRQGDPLRNEQWYLGAIHAPEAWQQTTGSSDVVIGIIDTGVDYEHEDLAQQIWVNDAEDLNGNGRLDSLDLNGIDDDQNGYVDDVVGWDFTNAPNFPDRGDFLHPDNDPMDEFLSGHGTQAAGIIAATRDNGIGISGIAPDARVMPLRAGTSSGFLEEDDVAEAIVYAVENGCKIVNMSFGDVAVSFLLRDAIAYGAQNGVLFVASAGNSSTSAANYPAAFDETVSVGATNENNSLAPFSNFGSKLDIVAPGQQVMATEINDDYGPVDGTSFSAPVVAGVAALIWSANPQFSAEQVKSALFAGAEDYGLFGWDTFYGHGRVDALGSLNVGQQGVARITHPATDTGVAADEIAIMGSVFGPTLQAFTLGYGPGATPQLISPLVDVAGQQAVDDTLFLWDVSALPDSTYTLELRVEQAGVNDVVFRSTFRLDRTPPTITEMDTVQMMVGPDNGYLITFSSDDPVSAELRLRSGGNTSPDVIRTSSYFRHEHHFLISQADISGELAFDIKIENSAGLTSVIDDAGQLFQLTLDEALPFGNVLLSEEVLPFSGFLMPELADINGNGQLDLVHSDLNSDNQFGPVVVREYHNGIFEPRLTTDFPGIPRDAAVLFSEGGANILSGFGSNSLILGGNSAFSYPTTISWFDTTDFWGSRFANLDDDAAPELLALTFGDWKVFDIDDDYQLVEQFLLADTTAGSNQFGVPISQVADLDNDGRQEIIIADLDGDIYIYEYDGAAYPFKWAERLDGRGGNGLLSVADVTGDGVPELISVVRNEPEVILESNVNTRYWVMDVWTASGDNKYKRIGRQNFHGVTVQPGVFNGLSVVDVDQNGQSEVLFTPFPEAYLLEWQDGKMAVRWYQNGLNSNAALQDDFDGDGRTEVLINSDAGLIRFESTFDANRPSPPLQLTAAALEIDRIRLNWRETAQADIYRIYRGDATGSLVLHDSTNSGYFLDTLLTEGAEYSYAVSLVDGAFDIAESALSEVVKATPNQPPTLLSSTVLNPRQLRLAFSEPMSDGAFLSERYLIEGIEKFPLSALRAADGKEVLISFDKPIDAGNYVLRATDLKDRDNTPMVVDTLQIPFTIELDAELLYVRSVQFLNKRALKVVFNSAVDLLSAGNAANYALSPDGAVLAAQPDSSDNRVVLLELDGKNRMGALGVAYTLTVSDINGLDGRVLDSERANRIGIPVAAAVFEDVFVYPNPYNVTMHDGPLRFANLPRDSEVFIFSSGGELLQTLTVENDLGGVSWDLMTTGGGFIESGVYIYVVRLNGGEEKGKFVIVK